MRGLYLYCFRERTGDAPEITAKGIDGAEGVFTVPYEGLEAVVSEVSLEEFGSGEIRKRAREDLQWIKEKALAHEKVIEEAMRNKDKPVSVIPMRFGTIFRGKAGLEETLARDYAKAAEILNKIRGKQEWSVKIFLKDGQKLERTIKEENEAIRNKGDELAVLPEGMAFFREEELKGLIAAEAEKEVRNIAGEVFEALRRRAGDGVRNRVLGKELTGRPDPMVSNAAYLVHVERTGDFRREVEDLDQKIRTKGFCLEYGGPWPAYNFVSF